MLNTILSASLRMLKSSFRSAAVCALALPLLAAFGGRSAIAQLSSPQRPTNDSAIVLGDFYTASNTPGTITFSDSISEPLVAVYFDPGPGGIQEFSNVSVTGCFNGPVHLEANTLCTINFTLNPQFTGPRTNVVHILTASANAAWGVLYRGVGSQVTFSPANISSIPLSSPGQQPHAIAIDGQGNLLFALPTRYLIQEYYAASQTIGTIAGDSTAGDSGDNGKSYLATIGTVRAMTIAPNGDLYFLGDGPAPGQLAIRRVNLNTQIITTVAVVTDAGTGFTSPDLAVDAQGRVYVSFPSLGYVDSFQNGNEINVVAGNSGSTPQCGSLSAPGALTLDPNTGVLYIADAARIVATTPNPSTLACTGLATVAGTGTAGYSGDGGAPTAAQLSSTITGLAIQSDLLYAADSGNFAVRQINLTGNTIATIAGNGTAGYSGDGGPSIYAQLQSMGALKLDPAGKLYLADGVDDVVRQIDVSTAAEFYYETSPIGQQSVDSPKTLTVTDSGNQQLWVGILPGNTDPYTTPGFVIDPGSTCPVIPGSSTNAVNPGFSCTLLLGFVPTINGVQTGSLNYVDNAASGTQSVPLSGTGTNIYPVLQIAPTYVGFSSVPVGSTGNAWTLNVSNTSSIAANLGSVVLSDYADFKVTNYCGSYLAAYSSCNILVYFTPQTAAYLTGTLTLAYNGKPSPLTVQLAGTGTANPITVTASPTNVTFGSVTQGTTSNPWTINVSNQSGSPATLNSLLLSDASDFSFTSYCGSTLAAYSSCTVLVYFTPKSTGYIAGTLTLTDNGTPSTQVIQLSGTGTSSSPTAFVAPNSINFGNQPVGSTSNSWTATLNNTSASPLAISSMSVSNPAFSFVSYCGSTLAAYSTCNITLTFTPSYVGTASGALNIYDNAQGGGYQGITLTGYGTSSTPAVQIAPTSVNFSSQTVGSPSNPWTLNFSNMGGSAVTISSIVLSDTTNFSYTSYCGSTVGAYSSCNILVYFNPQGTNTYNATLVVNSNGAPAAVTAYLNGYGSAKPTGYLISVNPSAFTLKAGQSATAAFTFAPYGGYTGSVSFGCSGLPAGAACKFAPAALTADGSDKSQTSQLTVTTSGIGAQALNSPGNHSPGSRRSVPPVLWAMPMLLVGLLTTRRRKLPRRLLIALAGLTLMAAASGCGSSFGGLVTPTGTSSVTVTATSSATGTSGTAATTQTATITLTITQ